MSLRWTEEELEEYQKRVRVEGTHVRVRSATKPCRGSVAPPDQEPPYEDDEQITLFDWARANEGKWPELARLFHVPNGGSRGPAEAGRFKAMGVKRGVPDVFLDVPRGGYHGLRIEMKRRRGGVLSDDQADWIDWYNSNGYRAVVCYGWDEARMEIEDYLRGGPEDGME